MRISSLDEIARDMSRPGSHATLARAFVHQSNEEKRVFNVLLNAAQLFGKGEKALALDTLLSIRNVLHFLPLPVIANVIWLCRQMGRSQQAAHECVKFAEDAVDMGFADLGLEASSAALILDSASQFEIIRNPAASFRVARLYEKTAVSCELPLKSITREPRSEYPLHIAMLVPNLVDYIVAYAKRVLHFARYLDRKKYRFSVYVTENLSFREAPLFPFGPHAGCSEETGKDTIAELRELGIPVYIHSRKSRFTEAASALVRKLLDDQVDAAVFQSSLACPIDWLTARLTPVPVRVCIHTGSTMFVPGMDACFFDNPENMKREVEWWSEKMGRGIFLPKGADLAELRRQECLSRDPLGVPRSATVIGTLSNHLAERLSESYMALIADSLKKNPSAWFVAFGSDTLHEKQAFFEAQGVGDRVRFGGRQIRSGAALKVLDIYAVEFPVGGSQSVIEAMACGVPVVAMKWGDAHAESVAAQIVGEELAVPHRDHASYARLLQHWITNPEARKTAGQKLQRRAEQYHSVEQYVEQLLNCVEGLYWTKIENPKRDRDNIPVSSEELQR